MRGVLVLLPGARIDYEDLRQLVVEVEVRDSTNPLTWLTARRQLVVDVLDVDDLFVQSVSALDDFDGEDDNLEAVFPTSGCGGLRCVRLTGSNLGPTQDYLQREGSTGIPSL